MNTHEEHNSDPNDNAADLVGRQYVFGDGVVLAVLQSKRRELGYWITYTITSPNALGKKLVMSVGEFRQRFDHLFR